MSANVIPLVPRSKPRPAMQRTATAEVVRLPVRRSPGVGRPGNVADAHTATSPAFSRFKNEVGMPVTDLEVADWCKRVGWHVLTANQRSFIGTILVTIHERPLTDAQADWLEGLVTKINRQVFGGDVA